MSNKSHQIVEHHAGLWRLCAACRRGLSGVAVEAVLQADAKEDLALTWGALFAANRDTFSSCSARGAWGWAILSQPGPGRLASSQQRQGGTPTLLSSIMLAR